MPEVFGNLYDSISSPTQLGGNLNNYSANGFDNITFNSTIVTSPNYTDLCFHGGVLHVVWVELQWDAVTSKKLVRGPFVKKWTGSAWVAVGGEVEPSLTPASAPTTNPPKNVRRPQFAVGTKFWPQVPRIVSNGTDLFVVYAIHKVDVAPHRPPNDSGSISTEQTYEAFTWPAWDHRLAPGEITLWDAKWTYIRKWNGTTWDLYGQIAPKTFNTHSYDPDSAFRHPFPSYITSVDIGPNGVYVALTEEGYPGPVEGYTNPPAFFMGFDFGHKWYGQGRRTLIARFDGSDVNGEVKVLHEEGTSAYIDSGDNDWTYTNRIMQLRMQAVDSDCQIHIIRQTGHKQVISFTISTAIDDERYRLLRFSDLAILKELTTRAAALNRGYVSFDQVPAFGFSNARRKYYICGQSISDPYNSQTLQTSSDDDLGWVQIDEDIFGHVPFGPQVLEFTVAFPRIIIDEPENLWGFSRTFTSPVQENHIMLYHRPCRAWTVYGYVSGDYSTRRAASLVSMVRDGNNLYTSSVYYNPTNLAEDQSIKVYRIPILRHQNTCGSIVRRILAYYKEGAWHMAPRVSSEPGNHNLVREHGEEWDLVKDDAGVRLNEFWHQPLE